MKKELLAAEKVSLLHDLKIEQHRDISCRISTFEWYIIWCDYIKMGASQLNQSRFEYLFWVSFLFKI
jgi:hypothetical protein